MDPLIDQASDGRAFQKSDKLSKSRLTGNWKFFFPFQTTKKFHISERCFTISNFAMIEEINEVEGEKTTMHPAL